MGFCYQSWNFTKFAPKLYQTCMFFATIKKLSINVESQYFLTLSAKWHECKLEERDGHEKL